MEVLIIMDITYHKEGDYFIPNLYLEKDKYKKDYQIGKYGHLRLQYLKNHKLQILMNQMLEKNPIDENLKDTDPLKWTGLMNNYKHLVEEIILKELIYI